MIKIPLTAFGLIAVHQHIVLLSHLAVEKLEQQAFTPVRILCKLLDRTVEVAIGSNVQCYAEFISNSLKLRSHTPVAGLDDDYSFFCYKFNRSLKYGDWLHKRSLGTSFLTVVDFLKSCPKITSIAFAQQGDFMGGPNGGFSQAVKTKRKTMNSFFCLTGRRFNFVSRLNEDVNTYMTLGMRGEIFLTINQISLNQQTTQANAGGMTEAYLSSGTYVKSFYTVMAMPSSTKIMPMGWTNPRLHHRISWNNSVPKIIDDSHKKT